MPSWHGTVEGGALKKGTTKDTKKEGNGSAFYVHDGYSTDFFVPFVFLGDLVRYPNPKNSYAFVQLVLPLRSGRTRGREKNVRVAIEKLSSYPDIRQSLDAGRLVIRGAIYDLETGQVELPDE